MPKRAQIIKNKRLRATPTTWPQVTCTNAVQATKNSADSNFPLYFAAIVLVFALSFALSAVYQLAKPNIQELRMKK